MSSNILSMPWPIALIIIVGALASLYYIVKWVLSEFTGQCPAGLQPDSLDKTRCIPICSGGQFFDRTTNKCRDCPAGQVKGDDGTCVIQCTDGKTWCQAGQACITQAFQCLESGICSNELVDPVTKLCGTCPVGQLNKDGTCCASGTLYYGGTCCETANQQTTDGKTEECCKPENFSSTDGCCTDIEKLHDGKCMTECIDGSGTVNWCNPATESCKNGQCFTNGCLFASPVLDKRKQLGVDADRQIFGCSPNTTETVLFDNQKGPWRTCGSTDTHWDSTTHRVSEDSKPCYPKDCFAINNIEGILSSDYKDNATQSDNCTASFACNKSTNTKEACGECPLNNTQCCMSGVTYAGMVCDEGNACISDPAGRGFRCVSSTLAKQCADYETKGCANGGKMIPCTYNSETMDAHCDCDNIPGLHDAYGINDNGNCINDGRCPPILHFRDGERCEGGVKFYDRTVFHLWNDGHTGDIGDNIYSVNQDAWGFVVKNCKSNRLTHTGVHHWGNKQSVNCVVCGDFPAAHGGDDVSIIGLCGIGGDHAPRQMPQK